MTDTGGMTLLNSQGAVARRRQRDKVIHCPIDHEAKKSVSVGMKRDLSLTAIKTIQSALWIEPRTDWLDLNKFGGWTRSDETSLVTYNMLPQAWSLPDDEKVTAKYWRGRSQLDCSMDHKRHDLSVKSIPLEGSRGIAQQVNLNQRQRERERWKWRKRNTTAHLQPLHHSWLRSPTPPDQPVEKQTVAYLGRRGTRLLFRKSFPRWWTKNTSKPNLHTPRRKRGRLGFRTLGFLSGGWAEDNDNGTDEDNFWWLEEEHKEEDLLPPSRRKDSLGGWVRISPHRVNESWITFT